MTSPLGERALMTSSSGGGGGGGSDDEASSLYSCDAEGYYTSFHIDSGLKTLKVPPINISIHFSFTVS